MGSQFVIPVYQRNYTWNPDGETARFMSNIEDLLRHKNANHFLGILIYKEFDRSAMYKEFSIVDGQQRLTTSFLFLACLKRIALENKDRETSGMIEDFYLYNRHASADARLRLKPTIADDDTYERLIYGSKKDLTRKDRESNVFRNYEAIYQRISEMTRKYRLLEILDTLSRMDILAFPLSEMDDSQQIFESINSTGAPLTSADLIRNYILMNDPSDVQERNYRLYWHPLEEYYPQSRKLEEFFRIYLAAKTYSFLSKRDVYEGFKTYWNAQKGTHEELLQEINRYARYYWAVYNGSAEDETVEAVLRDFRRNESRIPAPFLVEMYRLYDDEKIDSYMQTIQEFFIFNKLFVVYFHVLDEFIHVDLVAEIIRSVLGITFYRIKNFVPKLDRVLNDRIHSLIESHLHGCFRGFFGRGCRGVGCCHGGRGFGFSRERSFCRCKNEFLPCTAAVTPLDELCACIRAALEYIESGFFLSLL